MAAPDIPDVTLASVNPAILLCWEEQVRQGMECSLFLKHRKGKFITILKCTNYESSEAKAKSNVQSQAEIHLRNKKVKDKKTIASAPPPPIEANTKKRKGTSKKKRLEALLSYHQRLVLEKGLPPSRLMLLQAEVASSPSILNEKSANEDAILFKCDYCEHTASSMHEVNAHMSCIHKEQLKLADHVVDSSSVQMIEDEKSDDSLSPSFKCPSCRKIFETEHTLAIHIGSPISGGCGDGDLIDVKCQFCEYVTVKCALMVNHVQEKHRRTHSFLKVLKKHFTGFSLPDPVDCNIFCRDYHPTLLL